MKSPLATSGKINSTKSRTVYLGFQTEVNRVVYPIAVFKFDRKNAYCWQWLENGKGYFSYMDFTTGRAENFGKCLDSQSARSVLTKRFGLGAWKVGSGNIQLVIAGEPIR
jgi:hypothetical protein